MHLLNYMYRQPTNALFDMQASEWICCGHWSGVSGCFGSSCGKSHLDLTRTEDHKLLFLEEMDV